MTITEVENKLANYMILEKRIETLTRQVKKAGLLQIALSQAPDGIIPVDLTEPRVQISHEHWLDHFEKAYKKLGDKVEKISEEMGGCIERQYEIRAMVEGAGLTEEEITYCNMRYFEGKSVKEIASNWKDRTWAEEVRKEALKKIAERRI